MGYCDDNVERKLFAKQYKPNVDTIVLIGPEGDFSPAEVKAAMAAGFVPVTMGDNRLRTETAALVACDTCHIINQINS
jgi:16S rRNA (uracil1498-N3)-methyltransferase